MPGPDLKLDPEFLEELGKDLRVVASEFEHANDHSDRAAAAVGHGDLAEHVREFAHNWDDRRKKMLGNIQTLGESAVVVGQSFQDVDAELVKALKGEE